MIVVARHGRTEWNAVGRFQGWADVGLDELGRAQASELAETLSARVAAPAVVVSSDLPRAVQTATPVAAALGTDLVVAEDLREVDVGRWQGLTDAEAAALEPEVHRRWRAGEDVRRGGGETYAEAGARVAGFLTRLAGSTPPDRAIVAVGHGMSLRFGLEALAGAGLIDLGGPAPHLGNAAHLVLRDWRSRRGG